MNPLVLSLLAGEASAMFLPIPLAKIFDNHECPIDIPLSCSNKTEVTNSCCFEYPGGILLQTQFWDYYPPIGPSDMFTLHGLWPDKCDGSYEQFCDDSRNIDSAEAVLSKFGKTKLIEKMKSFWKNFNGNDEQLWVHEFNKHATCMSTLEDGCYEGLGTKPQQNVVDFYEKTVEIFETLPTYKWLVAAGIEPSTDKTYSRDAIEKALADQFGHPVYISCNRYNALQEVWYFHHLRGSVVTGEFVPIPSMLNSRCPADGIKWIPKKGFKPPTPTKTQPIGPGPTGGSGGYLRPAGHPGCIISNGHWYSSGTCATFHLFKAPFGGYNLKSSKGYCAPDKDGYLTCGPHVSAKQFQFEKSTKMLTYGGRKGWSAAHVPGRFEQVPVKMGKDEEVQFELRFG